MKHLSVELGIPSSDSRIVAIERAARSRTNIPFASASQPSITASKMNKEINLMSKLYVVVLSQTPHAPWNAMAFGAQLQLQSQLNVHPRQQPSTLSSSIFQCIFPREIEKRRIIHNQSSRSSWIKAER